MDQDYNRGVASSRHSSVNCSTFIEDILSLLLSRVGQLSSTDEIIHTLSTGKPLESSLPRNSVIWDSAQENLSSGFENNKKGQISLCIRRQVFPHRGPHDN